MSTHAISWRALVVGGAVCIASTLAPAAPALASNAIAALNSSGVAVAGVTVAGANCTTPVLSEPFLSWGDSNLYTLAPGQSAGGFNGSGWTLATGASVTSTTLLNGSTGSVLDLPPGSLALSAPVCVQSDYPTARTMIQSSPGGHVAVGVVYADALGGSGVTESALQSDVSGNITGSSTWAPSVAFQVHPGNLSGWQVVQFVFANTSKRDVQLYDFYVDPRMSH